MTNDTSARSAAQKSKFTAALFCTSSLLALCASGAALAQAPVQTAQASQAAEVPEQVLVTGSLITGTPAVGVPVSNLKELNFRETGQLTTTDILKSVSALQIDTMPSPTYGGGTAAFLQPVKIHNIGAGRGVETLLLIDGLRYPTQNYLLDTVNPSIIPSIALDRVDVLTAGASAVYGSDAMAGVINLILKRGYDGALSQFSVTTSPGMGWFETQAAQLYGRTWDTGDITVSYTFTDSKSISGSERSYYTQDFRPWGLMDLTPRSSAFPGIVHSGNAANLPGAPTGLTAATGTDFCATSGPGACYSIPQGQNGVGLSWAAILANPGIKNLRNTWAYADSRPQLQYNQGTVTFDQRLTNDLYGLGPVSFFADGFYSSQRGRQIYPAAVGQGRNSLFLNLAVPTTNPYYPTGTRCTTNPSTASPNGVPAGCTPTNLRLDYSFEVETPVIDVGGEYAARYSGGLNFDGLPFDWRGKLTYSMNDDKNFANATTVNPNSVSAALGWTVPNTTAGSTAGSSLTKPANIPYLNVFCDPTAFTCNDPATLAYINGYRNQHEQIRLQETSFNFNGPVFQLPGGPIEFAIAGQTLSSNYWFNETQNYATSGTPVVSNLTSTAEQRSYALFGQANIPVVGPNNALPFVESLVFELGYRYDKYNNIDNPAYTPKAAVNWGVGGGLTMRGAWGKSFRAPGFSEADDAGSRVSGINPLAGTSANTLVFGCSSGSAVAGSPTAILNPTCSNLEALRQPAGISVELSGNGAAAILRGHGIEPERLTQWTMGFNYAPSKPIFGGFDLSGLNVDVSWFRLEFKGIIDNNTYGNDNPDDPASAPEFIFLPRVDLPITAPENASFYALAQQLIAVPQHNGFPFDPAFLNNVKYIRDVALTNQGSRVFSGIDFDARYDFDLGKLGFDNIGTLNIGANGYYETIDKTRPTTAATLASVYSGRDSGNHLKRVRYRLGWANDVWNVTLFANYTGHGIYGTIPGNNVNGAVLIPPCFYAPGFGAGSCYPGSPYYGTGATVFNNMTPATVYFDLSIGYQTGDMPANEYLRNIGVQFTVNDLFDKAPPFQVGARSRDAVRGFDNHYSDLQRTFTLTLTKKW